MISRLRPSPAMVVSLAALVVSASGTAYAASQLPAKSVGAKQLKANAVTSSTVKNGSLTVADFAPGGVPAGPPGPAGPVGPAGAAGSPARSQSAGAWATRSPGFLIPMSPTLTPMFSLTEFADSSTGVLRVSGPSRLVVNGHVTLSAADPRYGARASCRVETKENARWAGVGLTHSVVIRQQQSHPISAVADVDASVSDVRIACASVGADSLFIDGSFTVVVTDR
jgi:hypothetical protein